MARLIFSNPPKKYKDYQDYRDWLEKNSYPKFCGYSWLIDQKSLSIDHYKPKEHYPELKGSPDNLILCTLDSNSAKNDYHPKATNRRVYKNDNQHIFNYRNEDVGKYVKTKKDGSLTYRLVFYKKRVNFNEKVFKFNRPHDKEVRREYLSLLKNLCSMYDTIKDMKKEKNNQYLKRAELYFEQVKTACSRRLIFYKLLNIKIPQHIEKLLTNKTASNFK